MPRQDRDDKGRFEVKATEQDFLKVFDAYTTDVDPYLTVTEVKRGLLQDFDVDLTNEAVRARLETMRDDGTVVKRDFGNAVAYRATVAPELDPGVKQSLDRPPTSRVDHDSV